MILTVPRDGGSGQVGPGIDDLKAAGLLDPIDAAMEQLVLETGPEGD